jgi:hypothetical protein
VSPRPHDRPTLEEAAAVMAAADAYARAIHEHAGSPPASDLPRLLAELETSIRRLRAVTTE